MRRGAALDLTGPSRRGRHGGDVRRLVAGKAQLIRLAEARASGQHMEGLGLTARTWTAAADLRLPGGDGGEDALRGERRTRTGLVLQLERAQGCRVRVQSREREWKLGKTREKEQTPPVVHLKQYNTHFDHQMPCHTHFDHEMILQGHAPAPSRRGACRAPWHRPSCRACPPCPSPR